MAMKIMDCFGAGGSFSEFYLVDYNDDVVLSGTTGRPIPASPRATWGWSRSRVYHGKPGRGLSIQMAVRHGPVTLLSRRAGPGRRHVPSGAETSGLIAPPCLR